MYKHMCDCDYCGYEEESEDMIPDNTGEYPSFTNASDTKARELDRLRYLEERSKMSSEDVLKEEASILFLKKLFGRFRK